MTDFKKRLEMKMKERGFTMQGLATAAGLEEGAVKNIMYERSLHPRINTVEKLAKALGCHVTELLSPQWHMQEGFKESLMRDVMKAAMRIYIERSEVAGLDLNWYYDMVIAAYKKYSKEESDKIPVNDNTVYAWLDGWLDAKK